jgi:histone acetyltransferase
MTLAPFSSAGYPGTANKLGTADLADFSTMETKLENNHYENVDSFLLDCQLIFSNCRKYNGENDNQYSKAANKLEKSLDKILRKRMANAPI